MHACVCIATTLITASYRYRYSIFSFYLFDAVQLAMRYLKCSSSSNGSFGHPVLVELIHVKTGTSYFVVMTADRC